MSVETDLKTALENDSGVNGIVSTRIYPVLLPDNVTYPAIAYSLISTNPVGSNGCYQSRIQIDGYAATYAAVKSIRDALIALANSVNHYTPQVNVDAYEDDSRVYHQPVDFMIIHS